MVRHRMKAGYKLLVIPIRAFIEDSRATGVSLILCTIISMAVSNGLDGPGYIAFWNTNVGWLHAYHLPHSPLHIINDGLMALFFFLAGLEIKKELIDGELSTLRKSMLPVLAALGGMIVPALIYFMWCGGSVYSKGWGIPIATDIAFSLGVLSLLGKRAPLSLKIFLTALAIIDDIGGILTIAIFYAGGIDWPYLLIAALIVAVLATLSYFKKGATVLYLAAGIVLWFCVYNSGVHPTIAGVALALTIPAERIEKLEHWLHTPVNFIVLPLFALANTAILLPASFDTVYRSPIHHGVFMGLVLGKPVGILLFCFAAVKFRLADLPSGITWNKILGVGMIAGIGFTISIFMSALAFPEPAPQLIAKVAIIEASLFSGVAGYLVLRLFTRRTQKELF